MFVLDTNVVSESRRFASNRADVHVAAWIARHPFSLYFLSAITVLELEQGILLKQRRDPAQAATLRRWFEERVVPAFAGRVLPIESAVARMCARLHVPDPQPERDAFIAATALVHGLTIVTRNVAAFQPMGVPVLNPWTP